MSHVKTVALALAQPGQTEEQQAFNSLVRQIEARRTHLAAWEAAMPPYQQKHVSKLQPLVEEWGGLQVAMVLSLDRASHMLGKSERLAIADVIADLAEQLAGHRENEELAAIYRRHGVRDEAPADDAVQVPPLAAGADEETPAAMLERLDARLAAEQQVRDERRAARKKSTRQVAIQARLAEEDQQASQSLREVYRRLASALHPDRESEPLERARKTALMQRVNQAYDGKNLLALLELQLESEHSALGRLGAVRLKHYNRVLRRQLGELEQEIRRLEGRFRTRFGATGKLTPDTLMRHLNRDIAGLQRLLPVLKANLRACADPITLRAWLRENR